MKIAAELHIRDGEAAWQVVTQLTSHPGKHMPATVALRQDLMAHLETCPLDPWHRSCQHMQDRGIPAISNAGECQLTLRQL